MLANISDPVNHRLLRNGAESGGQVLPEPEECGQPLGCEDDGSPAGVPHPPGAGPRAAHVQDRGHPAGTIKAADAARAVVTRSSDSNSPLPLLAGGVWVC